MRNQTISQSILLVAALAFASGLMGCDRGPKRVPVGGTVTVDGTLLVHGSVTFIAAPGVECKPGGGSIKPDGRFQITSIDPYDGLMPGKYTVVVSAIEPINGAAQRWHAPKFYSMAGKSDIVFDITDTGDDEANNNLEIELTWDKDSKHSKPFVERF